jgi:hypothetical protein
VWQLGVQQFGDGGCSIKKITRRFGRVIFKGHLKKLTCADVLVCSKKPLIYRVFFGKAPRLRYPY